MDLKKIEAGISLVLEGIEEKTDREGLKMTPSRVARMYAEILAGIDQEAVLDSQFLSQAASNDLILVRDIQFYSLCEHHLLPFFGKVHIAYLPEAGRIAGFSGISRLVDILSRRLQIQERLTHQIADAVMAGVKPRGVFVVVEAQQLCLSMRGTRKESARAVTQAVRGDFPLERARLSGIISG